MNIDTLQLVWGGNTRKVCGVVMGCLHRYSHSLCLLEVGLIIIAVSSLLLKPHMHNCIIPAHYQILTHQIPETHWVFLYHLLVVCHRCEPNDGDDRVQNKREEEVFVQRDPLAAQTPTGGGKTSRWQDNLDPCKDLLSASVDSLEVEKYSKGDEEGCEWQPVSDES